MLTRKDLEIGMLVMWKQSKHQAEAEVMVVDTVPWKVVKERHATKPWSVNVARRSKPGSMGVAMAEQPRSGEWFLWSGFCVSCPPSMRS